jgi:hypothetical protein
MSNLVTITDRQPKTGPVWAVLQEFAKVTRPILHDYYLPNCCIAATAVTVRVLGALGISALPLPCRVRIFNRAYVWEMEKSMVEGNPIPLNHTLTDNGAWSVGIGFTPPGHVAVIADNKYLVDPTLDQANRPQHTITLPPVFLSVVSRPFRRGIVRHVDEANGCVIGYDARPRDTAWRGSIDWTDQERHDGAVGRILYALGHGSRAGSGSGSVRKAGGI